MRQPSKLRGRNSAAWGQWRYAHLEEAIFGQILEGCELCACRERIMVQAKQTASAKALKQKCA